MRTRSIPIEQFHKTLRFRTKDRGVTNITDEVERVLANSDVFGGLVTLHCVHTSASLLIQENSDPNVIRDLETWFNRVIPRDENFWAHRTEGPDDMPAHVRAALTQSSITLPFSGKQLILGQWQAIYLYEHRDDVHERSVIVHVIGEQRLGD